MAITLDQFIAKWTNKKCDFDGAFGTQCMDLMDYYCLEVLGMSREDIIAKMFNANAVGLYNTYKADSYFDKIPNSLLNAPKEGDIFFFGKNVGVDGHVCIVTKANVMNFTSFDANWPVGTLPHLQTHNYNGAVGWLRYKYPSNALADLQAQVAKLTQALVDNKKALQSALDNYKGL